MHVLKCMSLLCFREFLTGFRKRKAERRKVAQEQIIARLKEEKKKLKQKVRGWLYNLFLLTTEVTMQ